MENENRAQFAKEAMQNNVYKKEVKKYYLYDGQVKIKPRSSTARKAKNGRIGNGYRSTIITRSR